jgi:hypothetical protein
MLVEVPRGPSIGTTVKGWPFDAQVRFCSDEGKCQTTETKAYIDEVRKDRGVGRFTLVGRFSATFADGWVRMFFEDCRKSASSICRRVAVWILTWDDRFWKKRIAAWTGVGNGECATHDEKACL